MSINIFNTELTDKQLTKYISSAYERHCYLLSIIMEIKFIKEQNPDIDYIHAIRKSKYYQVVMSHLFKRYRSKFRVKVAYFWYKTYENIDFNTWGMET